MKTSIALAALLLAPLAAVAADKPLDFAPGSAFRYSNTGYVLLGMLMLRGPQTAGELRLNTERWHKFLDIASVDGFLEELQDRSDEKGGPLVVKLPRAPGAREQRWAHLLCGPVDASALAAMPSPVAHQATEDEMIALTRRLATLENTVAQLQAQLQNLSEQLGLSQPGQP